MTVTPFDTVGRISPATPRQRQALMEMGMEKAVLIKKDRTAAEQELRRWINQLDRETASKAIRRLGEDLDEERLRQGLDVHAWTHRAHE